MNFRYHAQPGELSQVQFVCESEAGEINYTVTFVAAEAESLIMSFVTAPFHIPVERRSLVAEYMTRVNFGSRFETLEMDLNTGAFQVRTSMIIDGGRLSGDMVRHMLYGPMNWMDRHLPGIIGIALARMTPKQAIAEI